MALVDLLKLETDAVLIAIKGPDPAQVFCVGQPSEPPNFSLDGAEAEVSAFHPVERALRDGPPTIPLFFEQQTYQIIVEGLGSRPVRLADHRALTPGPASSTQPIRFYTMNFGSDVGDADLVVLVGEQPYLRLTIEVLPTKVDYRTDYQQMVSEIHAEARDLAYSLLSKTVRGVRPDHGATPPTSYEWLSLLEWMSRRFQRAVDQVLRQPNHRIVSSEVMRPLDRIKHPGPSARKWIRTHPEVHRALLCGGVAHGNVRLPELRRKISYDTPENRFVKHVLRRVVLELRGLLKTIQLWNPGVDRGDLLQRLGVLERTFQQRLVRPLFTHVGELAPNFQPSLVLQYGSGYREVLQAYLLLLRGLAIEGRVLRLGLKSLHELYQYWCLLRIREILARRYPMRSHTLLRFSRNRLVLTLQAGRTQEIIFDAPDGSTIELGYCLVPEGGRHPTVQPEPDFVLTLERKLDGKPLPGGIHRLIFDAKYRIESDPKYVERRGGVGPKEEDINTMHRYRDAYVTLDRDLQIYQREVTTACVLFPWKGPYHDHHFARSLSEVGVGGLPFLPGATEMVEDFLDELLAISDPEHVERSLLPRGFQVFWEPRYRHEPVLVGALGVAREQTRRLRFLQEHSYYHIPADRLSPGKVAVAYLAPFAAGQVAGYYPVINVELVQERSLPHIERLRPHRTLGGEGYYYRLDLDLSRYRQLHEPITNPGRRTVTHIYTTLDALLTAQTVDELYLRSELARRAMEGLRLRGIPLKITRIAPTRWEIRVAVGEENGGKDGAVIRPSTSKDGINVFLPGRSRRVFMPGPLVRGRPWVVGEEVLRVIGSGLTP